jgi:hypothetical protein
MNHKTRIVRAAKSMRLVREMKKVVVVWRTSLAFGLRINPVDGPNDPRLRFVRLTGEAGGGNQRSASVRFSLDHYEVTENHAEKERCPGNKDVTRIFHHLTNAAQAAFVQVQRAGLIRDLGFVIHLAFGIRHSSFCI